jgi:hypothetical protein
MSFTFESGKAWQTGMEILVAGALHHKSTWQGTFGASGKFALAVGCALQRGSALAVQPYGSDRMSPCRIGDE